MSSSSCSRTPKSKGVCLSRTGSDGLFWDCSEDGVKSSRTSHECSQNAKIFSWCCSLLLCSLLPHSLLSYFLLLCSLLCLLCIYSLLPTYLLQTIFLSTPNLPIG